jgi:hypothetical protein
LTLMHCGSWKGLPLSQMQDKDQDLGVLGVSIPSVTCIPYPVLPALSQEEGRHLIRQTDLASVALRRQRRENCKGYACSFANALFNFLLRM